MSANLIIDYYNAYMRSTFKSRTKVKSFFSYVNLLKKKYQAKRVYLVFDGTSFIKKEIDPSYKHNREAVFNSTESQAIKLIALNLPDFFVVTGDKLEADDMAFCLCKEYDNSICVSEDRDWLINILANKNIKVLHSNNEMIHQFNFESKYGFPVSKIPLFLFLSGDAKDGVKKPFRLKGSLQENLKEFMSVEEYCEKTCLSGPDMIKYQQLLNPIENIPFEVHVGHKTEATRQYLSRYKLSFLNNESSRKFLNDTFSGSIFN